MMDNTGKENSNVVWRTPYASLWIGDKGGTTVLMALADTDNSCQFADGSSPLWQVEMLDRKQKSRTLKPCWPCDNLLKTKDMMLLEWKFEGICKTEVEIRTNEAGQVECSIRIIPASKDWLVATVEFPRFDWIPDEDDNCFFVLPSCNGLRYPNPLHTVPEGGIIKEKRIRDRGYPHGAQNMQFLAMEKTGKVCYFAAHDRTAGCKHFPFRINQENKRIEVRPRVENSLKYGVAYHSFPWVFQVVKGDWFDAAMIYRSFALTTEWVEEGPLEESARVPEWLLNTPLVALRHDRGAGYEIEHYIKAAERLDTPMLIRYYMWMQSAFDTNYPFLFPAVPEFRGDVKTLHEHQIRVIPYMNFYSADTTGKHWPEIEHAAIEIDRHHNRHVAVWSQMRPLCAMCPADPAYAHQVKDQLLRMLELGVDGLYLDEFGMSPCFNCFSDKHGHEPGSPYAVTSGFKEIVGAVRSEAADFAPESVIAIETYAEQFIPDVDVFISGQIDIDYMVPLFQAVYHDYAFGGFGRTTFPPDVNDPAFAGAFMTKQAVQFIYGCQFGVARAPLLQILDDDPDAEALLKTLCLAWRHSNNYLARGKMLRPLALPVEEREYRWSYHWKDYTGHIVKLPQVLNSVWHVNDGSVGVVLVNITKEAVALPVMLPGVFMGDPLPEPFGGAENYHYPVPAMTAATLREYTASGMTEKMAKGNTHTGFYVTVPPLGCSVLIVSSEKDYYVHRQ